MSEGPSREQLKDGEMHADEHRSSTWRTDAAGGWRLPGSGDGGADMIVTGPDRMLHVIQCKVYDDPDPARASAPPQDAVDAYCPTCAAGAWPGPDDDTASSLTTAASRAFFFAGTMVHRDIRPENILIPPGEWKIADLGRARDLWPPEVEDTSADGRREPVDFRKIVRLLKHWDRVDQAPVPSLVREVFAQELVAKESTAHLDFEQLVLTLLTAARAAGCAVRAAYHARDAVVHQGPALSRPVVARFAQQWLGLSATDENIYATSNALLQAPLAGVSRLFRSWLCFRW